MFDVSTQWVEPSGGNKFIGIMEVFLVVSHAPGTRIYLDLGIHGLVGCTLSDGLKKLTPGGTHLPSTGAPGEILGKPWDPGG